MHTPQTPIHNSYPVSPIAKDGLSRATKRWLAGAALVAIPGGVAAGYFGWKQESSAEMARAAQYTNCAAALVSEKVPSHQPVSVAQVPLTVQEKCGVLVTLQQMSASTKNPIRSSRLPDLLNGWVTVAGQSEVVVNLPDPSEYTETAERLRQSATDPANDIMMPFIGLLGGAAATPLVALSAYCMSKMPY